MTRQNPKLKLKINVGGKYPLDNVQSLHSAELREPPSPEVCAALITSVPQMPMKDRKKDAAETAWLEHGVQKVPRRV